MQQRRFLEALRLLDAFAPGHHLHPLAVLNKKLCFWFQGNRRKVRAIARELLALGLSQDTGGVVTLLRDSLGKDPPREITLGQEGMALLLDIIARALDLRETERAASLLRCLSKDCLSRHARVLGELFYRYGCLEEAGHHLREDLAQDPASAATCFLLGEIEHRQGKYLEAGDFYRRALALDPNEPRHYLGLITLYQEMRRAILREARERYPGSPILAALEEEPAGV
ncbi:MAG: tetratricopeptide repeat protein [Desulfotomaculales bacterium]